MTMLGTLVNTGSRLLDMPVLGNDLGDYGVAASAIAIGLALVKVLQLLVMSRLKRWFGSTSYSWDDFLVATLEVNAIPALYILVVYLGLRDLHMKEAFRVGLRALAVAGITVLAIRVVMAVVKQLFNRYWTRHSDERTAAREKNLNGIVAIANIVIWILGAILLLDNLGIRVSAFVAGLGVTGIAVALAAQTILGDLFGYFVIFFDRPFEVGHAIKVDDFVGEVEHIGLKTTRLRSLGGEQIIFSNKNLTESRILNFRRMQRRRAQFGFEVDYATDPGHLRAIPGVVKSLVAGFPDTSFDRAHFKEFGRSGLLFEAVYFVETPDYGRFMDIQQEVNLGLQAEMRRLGVDFAFAARTLQVKPRNGDGNGDESKDALRPGRDY